MCAVHRATVTGAPNFAYGRTERALASMDDRLDLSGLRLAFNGGEPIMAETVEGFLGAARRHGFPSAAMYCVYGLAEATLAVSFPPPGEGMQLDVVDGAPLEAEQRAVPTATGRRLVRLGRPIPGVALRICRPGPWRGTG